MKFLRRLPVKILYSFLIICVILISFPRTTYAAQAFRSASHYNTSGSTAERTTTEPTGVVQGDVLVMVILKNQSSMKLSLPTGWTSLGNASDGNLGYAIGWIARGSSAPSYTFGIGTTNTRTPQAFVFAFSGVDTTNPITDFQVSTTDTDGFESVGVGTDSDPPAVTAGTNDLILTGVARTLEYNTGAAPTGYTVQSNVNEIGVNAISDSLLSGSQDPVEFTGQTTGTEVIWHGYTLALAAAKASAKSIIKIKGGVRIKGGVKFR